MGNLHEVVNQILALAARLEDQTIETLLAKSDLEVGMEWWFHGSQPVTPQLQRTFFSEVASGHHFREHDPTGHPGHRNRFREHAGASEGSPRACPGRAARALGGSSGRLCPSPRDQALALVPFYAGARISEIVALDVDDVARSARKATLRIYGKGEQVRQVPIHPQLRTALASWLTERTDWPQAEDNAALFLNQRGDRLGARGAHHIITGIATTAGLDDDTTTHVLRHTFATTLVRGGTDLVIVAELLGHTRLETTRGYTRPTTEDRARALDLLLVDQ